MRVIVNWSSPPVSIRTLYARIRRFLGEQDGRFFRNTRSSFTSAFSFRSRSNSARSGSVTAVSPVSVRALKAQTQRPSGPAAQRGLVDAELTGDGRDCPAGVDHQLHGLICAPRSELPACVSHVNILSCEVSTERGQGHPFGWRGAIGRRPTCLSATRPAGQMLSARGTVEGRRHRFLGVRSSLDGATRAADVRFMRAPRLRHASVAPRTW